MVPAADLTTLKQSTSVEEPILAVTVVPEVGIVLAVAVVLLASVSFIPPPPPVGTQRDAGDGGMA
jgi:hypothetical protein